MTTQHIPAGTPMRCPFCHKPATLPICVDGWKVVRCECGGMASASLWVKHADRLRLN